MKDKTKRIIVISTILICLVIVTIAIIFSLKKDKESFEPSGNNSIANSIIASSQSEIDNTIKSDLEKNGYTLENAKIYINPYNTSPLSALAIFKTDKDVSVKVTLKGKHDDDLIENYEKSQYHYIPIYALYQDYENKIIIELSDGQKKEFTIKTGSLEFAPTAVVNKNETKNDSFYFLTSPLNMRSFAVDTYGEVRWYTDAMLYHNIQVLDDGHLLIGSGTDAATGLASDIIEIDYLGRIYKTYNISEGFLNDFYLKNDGNILVASKNKDRKTYSDYIIEVDKNTGKIVKTWDIFKKLEEIDPVYTNELKSDFFYNSGIYLDEATNSLLLTYWGGEFVINLDYNSGDIKWIFSDPKNFSNGFSRVLLKGTGDFKYPKAMHSAYMSGNTLKVFDNGYSTNQNDSNISNLKGSYSSANTYTIENNNITYRSLIDEDKKLFSYALGDYKTTKDDNELVLFGRELDGIDYNSEVNIHTYDKVSSRLIEKNASETILDMTIGWATYSVQKIEKTSNFVFDFREPSVYTTLMPTKYDELTDDIKAKLSNNLETIDYTFGYSNNTIEHNILFMDSDEAKLILVNKDGEGVIYTLKENGKRQIDKIITDLKKDTYYIYVLENGVMYKTDSKIEIK